MVYDNSLWLGSYDEGVSPEVEIEDSSLVERFEKMRKEFPDRIAVHFLGVSLTFEQLMSQADRFARCLVDHGLTKGDVVGVCLPNTPQYIITLIGTLKAGCVLSGLSPLYTAREMAHQLQDNGAKALVILDALFEHRFAGIADEAPDVKLVVPTMIVDFLPKFKQLLAKWLKKVPTGKIKPLPGKEVIPFMDILSKYPAQPPDVTLTPEDPFIIQYTGGTTGVPKGAVCTHRNMLSNVAQFAEWLRVEEGQEVVESAFPMFHIAGLFTSIICLAYGLTQILIPDPRNTKLIVGEMEKFKPQWLGNVPSLYMMLLNEPKFREMDHSRLKFCVSGAAGFPVDAIKKFEAIVGKEKVIEVFGMTETCVLLTCAPRFGVKKVGTSGIPLPSTSLMIVDLETGTKEMPLGEQGEICAAGPTLMNGYHNKPEETALALREHHGKLWMHTGDIGFMDEDGYLSVVDRKKDMILVGGFNVFPREIEERLYEHPAVEVCAAVGMANPDRPETELVKLVVQKSAAYSDKSDDEIEKELTAFARENLAPYKAPKVFEFKEVPLTAAGKVDKKLLR